MKLLDLLLGLDERRKKAKYKVAYLELKPRWDKLIEELPIPKRFKTYYADGYSYFDSAANYLFHDIFYKYAEEQRYYHTPNHLLECLRVLDEVKEMSESPQELELALWFHDCVYDPKAKDNEEKSAEFEYRLAFRMGLPYTFVKSSHGLVLITKHLELPKTTDEKLIVDIDLSIFGQPEPVFDAYEENIRKEYDFYPSEVYKPGRASILKMFLDRNPLYHTPQIREKYEEKAKENLQRSIEKLKS